MADQWPHREGSLQSPVLEAGSNTNANAPLRGVDGLGQSIFPELSPSRLRGRPELPELPAVREALLGTIDRASPDLQALYQASGTSVDELLEQKRAIDCLASASLINAGVQRQKKSDSEARKRSRSKADEIQGVFDLGGDTNDSGSEKHNKSTASWTEEEDKLLYELVARFGTSKWSLVASKFEDKTNKQCRRRWQTCSNLLGSKGAWTAEEDNQLIEGHAFFGNRWTDIAKLVPGRTDNAAKNRFFALLRKQAAAKAPKVDGGGTGLVVAPPTAQESDHPGTSGGHPTAGSHRTSFGGFSGLPQEKRVRENDDFDLDDFGGEQVTRIFGGALEDPHEPLRDKRFSGKRESAFGQGREEPFGKGRREQPGRGPEELSLGPLQGLFPQLGPGLHAGRSGTQFSEGLNLNVSDAQFLQQRKYAQEHGNQLRSESLPQGLEFPGRPENPLQDLRFSRSENLERDLRFLRPEDRLQHERSESFWHPPREGGLPGVPPQLDGLGETKLGEGEGNEPQPRSKPAGKAGKEPLDLDLNSTPLKWL